MKRSIFQFLFNRKMTEKEAYTWDQLKRDIIDSTKEPRKKVELALNAIKEVCDKRKKTTKGKLRTGFNDLLDNLTDEANMDLSLTDQIKILREGRETGWGSAWDSDLRKKLKILR